MPGLYELTRGVRVGLPAAAAVLRGPPRAGAVSDSSRQSFRVVPGERRRGDERRRVADVGLRHCDAGAGHRYRAAGARVSDRRSLHGVRFSAAHGPHRPPGRSVGDVVCHARGSSGSAGDAAGQYSVVPAPGHLAGAALRGGALCGAAASGPAALQPAVSSDHEHAGIARRNDTGRAGFARPHPQLLPSDQPGGLPDFAPVSD